MPSRPVRKNDAATGPGPGRLRPASRGFALETPQTAKTEQRWRRARRALGRLNLTLRFAIAAAVIVVALGGVLERALGHFVVQQALGDAEDEVHDFVLPRVLQQLRPADFTGPLDEARLAEIDEGVKQGVLSERTVRIKIWDAQGRIVYSDDRGQLGKVYPRRSELDEALDGQTVSTKASGNRPEHARERPFGALLEVYAPITFAGSESPVGAIEAYQTYARVAASIAEMQRYITIGLAGGLVLLYVGLLGIVHGGSRTIGRQHRDLERAFQERERLTAILEATPDTVSMAGATGDLLYVNRSGRRMAGLADEADLSGFSIAQMHPEWAARLVQEEAIPAAIRHGSWSGESAVRGPNGGEIPVSQVIVAHRTPAGNVEFLSTVIRDMSERKRAEEALRESEERFRALAQSASDAVISADSKSCILSWNDAAQRIFGYSFDEVRGRPITVLMPERYRRAALGGMQRAIGGVGSIAARPLDLEGLRKDGAEFPLELSIGMWLARGDVFFSGIIRDVTERRRTEDALRRSEEDFRLLFAANPQPMYVFDRDSLAFIEVNAAALGQYGYSREEFLQLKMTDIRPPDDVPRLLDTLASRDPVTVDSGEWRHRRKDGQELWVRITSHAIVFEGRPARLVSAEDITARREAEEAIARLAAIVESSEDAIVGRDPDGRIVTWNAGAERLYGYTAGEVLGTAFELPVPGDPDPQLQGAIARVRGGENIENVETARLTKDGRTIDVAITMFPVRGRDGEVLGVAGIHRDITARKLAERALAESERKFRGLVQSVDAIVWEAGGPSLRVTFVSDQAERILGYPVASWFAPGFWLDHVHQDDREATVETRARALRERQDYSIEYRVMAAGGRTVWLHDVVHVSGEEGEPARLRGVMFDITAHKEAEEAIVRLAALEERQRLARELHDSVSQALYGIGLGAYTAVTQFDQEPRRAREAMEYVMTLAEAGLTEMRALIFELRPDSLQREGLVPAIQRQCAAISARHGIAVDSTLCGEPPVSIEVKEVLYRIAQEATQNAVKHARAGHVQLTLRHEEGVIALDVRDDGVGFDPTGPFPGHLGLRSMRERAERVGGRVDIESAPGQGTCVRARIPFRPSA